MHQEANKEIKVDAYEAKAIQAAQHAMYSSSDLFKSEIQVKFIKMSTGKAEEAKPNMKIMKPNKHDFPIEV